jgi:hypothetical protein
MKELNGVSEKSVDTMKNHSRTMRIASGVPDQIGKHYAILHHVYIWNRTHVCKRTGKTPYEAMLKRKPNVLNLGVFGCDAFVHQDRSQRDTTYSAKGLPGIYLGHDPRQNAPLVRMLGSGKTIVAKDVIFREGSFAHAQALSTGRAASIAPMVLSEVNADDREVQPAAPINYEEVLEEDEKANEDQPADRAPEPSAEQFRVKAIRKERTIDGRKEYEVKWVGHAATTWEPADVIKADAPSAVKQFEEFLEQRAQARVTRSRATAPLFSGVVSEDSDDENDHSEQQQALAARAVAASRL